MAVQKLTGMAATNGDEWSRLQGVLVLPNLATLKNPLQESRVGKHVDYYAKPDVGSNQIFSTLLKAYSYTIQLKGQSAR